VVCRLDGIDAGWCQPKKSRQQAAYFDKGRLQAA